MYFFLTLALMNFFSDLINSQSLQHWKTAFMFKVYTNDWVPHQEGIVSEGVWGGHEDESWSYIRVFVVQTVMG